MARRAVSGLAILLATAAALAYLPVPTFPLWYAHVVAQELSLGLTAAALLLLLAARGRLQRLLLAAAASLGLLPLIAAYPVYVERGAGFSLHEYAFGPRSLDVRVRRDLVLEPAWPALSADLYEAPGTEPHPFVVVVHGGSWRGGDKGVAPHVSRQLARAGLSVVDVRYSFAPEAPFPRAVQELKCFLGRLRQRAPELGLDPQRAALLGRSAGGQIALAAAYSVGDPALLPACDVRDEGVQAVASIYAPIDLAWGYHHPFVPDVVRSTESLGLYLGGSPEARPEAYRQASPLSYVERSLPPTLLVHGLGDRLVSAEHARRLAPALRARRQPVDLLLLPLAEHGFDVRPGGVAEQLTREVLLRFLRAALLGRQPPRSLARNEPALGDAGPGTAPARSAPAP